MLKFCRNIFGVLIVLSVGAVYSQVPDSIINKIQAGAEPPDTSKVLLVIADVAVSGYKKTKLYIIQREVPFKNGDYILKSELHKKIELCRQQLMNTTLFVDVEVKIARQQNDLVFIDIHVKERWYLFPLPYFKLVARNLNEWLVEHKASLNRVNYGLKFMQNNVSGRNDKLNIWLVNGYTQQISFRYENPFLDKTLKHGMNLGFSYSRNREINFATDTLHESDEIKYNKQKLIKTEDNFITRQLHIDLAYSYRPAIKTRHNFRISYTDQQVKDTVLARNPKFFKGGSTSARFIDFSYNIQYFNVDYIPYPLKGFMGEAYIYKRGISSQNNMWQIGGKGTYSFKFNNKSYLQFQANGLLRVPFKQPYYTQRMFGSSDFYMRGLEYYVIDGAAGGFGRGTAKQEVLSLSIRNPIGTKTHDKIPLRVFLKGYGDAGYSYNPDPGNSIFNNKLLHTYGAGIDIITFYDLVFKLEYSFNQLGEGGFFFHTKADF